MAKEKEEENNDNLIHRQNPPTYKNYQKYREYLREDFWYSCAYCTITENEASGLSFEIDHYLPQKHFSEKTNEYLNLVYSCKTCNRYKTAFYPGKDGLPPEYYILRPDEHYYKDHYELDGIELKAKTIQGDHTIKMLYLNRQQLRRMRELRKQIDNVSDWIAHGISEMKNLSLDRFPPHVRAYVLSIRDKHSAQQQEVKSLFKETLKSFARSELINSDPEKKKDASVRRKHLRELKAITPEHRLLKKKK